MKHRLPSLFSVLLIVPLLLLACNGEAGPTDPSPAVGEYTLYQVNGQTPPIAFTLPNSTISREWLGGSLTLHSDGSYSEDFEVRDTPAGGSPQPPLTFTEDGSFRLVRGMIRLRPEGQNVERAATLVGDTLTYAVYPFEVTYLR